MKESSLRDEGCREGTNRRDVLKASAGLSGVGLLGGAGLFGNAAATPAQRATQTTGTHSFLWYNTWLLNEILGGWIQKAPDLEARATEIGQAIDTAGYDIAALCEVFDEDDRELLLSEIDSVRYRQGPEADVETGDYATDLEKSSGLQTLLTGSESDQSFAVHERHEFEADGVETRDAEAYANKGVLYTQVDLGEGRMDLFTTHMLSGGGLKALDEIFGWLSEDFSEAEVRARQLEEMARFIEETKAEHDPNNEHVTVVAGDFNIPAESDEFENLQAFKDRLGLYDAWERHGGEIGGTRGPEDFGGAGIEASCAVDPDGESPYRCTQNGDPEAAERIDYVLIEESRESHAYDLEVQDMTRVGFWRQLAPADEFWKVTDEDWFSDDERVPNYMSDHLGLELDLNVVPR